MSLESLTGGSVYINALVITNPGSSDTLTEGDDHLRGIKNVIKNTFPYITGAMTLTQAQLNDAAQQSGTNTFSGTNSITGTTTVTHGKLVDAVASTPFTPFVCGNVTNPANATPTYTGSGSVTIARTAQGTYTVTHGMGTANLCAWVSFADHTLSGTQAHIESIGATTFNLLIYGSGSSLLDTKFALFIAAY